MEHKTTISTINLGTSIINMFVLYSPTMNPIACSVFHIYPSGNIVNNIYKMDRNSRWCDTNDHHTTRSVVVMLDDRQEKLIGAQCMPHGKYSTAYVPQFLYRNTIDLGKIYYYRQASYRRPTCNVILNRKS